MQRAGVSDVRVVLPGSLLDVIMHINDKEESRTSLGSALHIATLF